MQNRYLQGSLQRNFRLRYRQSRLRASCAILPGSSRNCKGLPSLSRRLPNLPCRAFLGNRRHPMVIWYQWGSAYKDFLFTSVRFVVPSASFLKSPSSSNPWSPTPSWGNDVSVKIDVRIFLFTSVGFAIPSSAPSPPESPSYS